MDSSSQAGHSLLPKVLKGTVAIVLSVVLLLLGLQVAGLRAEQQALREALKTVQAHNELLEQEITELGVRMAWLNARAGGAQNGKGSSPAGLGGDANAAAHGGAEPAARGGARSKQRRRATRR